MPGLKNRLIFRKSGGFLNSEGFLQRAAPGPIQERAETDDIFRHRIGNFYKNV